MNFTDILKTALVISSCTVYKEDKNGKKIIQIQTDSKVQKLTDFYPNKEELGHQHSSANLLKNDIDDNYDKNLPDIQQIFKTQRASPSFTIKKTAIPKEIVMRPILLLEDAQPEILEASPIIEKEIVSSDQHQHQPLVLPNFADSIVSIEDASSEEVITEIDVDEQENKQPLLLTYDPTFYSGNLHLNADLPPPPFYDIHLHQQIPQQEAAHFPLVLREKTVTDEEESYIQVDTKVVILDPETEMNLNGEENDILLKGMQEIIDQHFK